MHRPLHGQRAYPVLFVRCVDADLRESGLFPAGRGPEHRAAQSLWPGHRQAGHADGIFLHDDEGPAV